MGKIRKKKYFFLVTSQEIFHLAKHIYMLVDLCLHLFKKSISITLKTPSFLSIQLSLGKYSFASFKGGLAVQTSGEGQCPWGGIDFSGGVSTPLHTMCKMVYGNSKPSRSSVTVPRNKLTKLKRWPGISRRKLVFKIMSLCFAWNNKHVTLGY